MLTLSFKPFNELTCDELYNVLALRAEVFVAGQQCAYLDCDYKDQQAIHCLGYHEARLHAYLRILPHSEGTAMSIGRVAARQEIRGLGFGKDIVQAGINYLNDSYPQQDIIISAQYYLLKFYQKFGFKEVGDVYDEDGIDHIRMEIKR